MSDQFEASADASHTVPLQASALRVGGFVVLRGFPCKIAEMTSAKTGKHGGCKVHLSAIDIFTNRKYEEHFMSTDNVDVPLVSKHEYQLIAVDDDGFLTLLSDKNAQTKEDLVAPDNEVGREIRDAISTEAEGDEEKTYFVQTMVAMGKEVVVSLSSK
jgi:translation initiation factor 5A